MESSTVLLLTMATLVLTHNIVSLKIKKKLSPVARRDTADVKFHLQVSFFMLWLLNECLFCCLLQSSY